MEETLRENGEERMCECGRVLVPAMQDGKRIGLRHKSMEDDTHHLEFFAGLRVKIGD